MARFRPIHFERHRHEAALNRRRFSLTLMGLMMVLSVAVGLHFRGSEAATTITLSGRVVNSSTGAGVPNVTMRLCYNSRTMVTNASGGWSLAVPYQARFCADVIGGKPAGLQRIQAVYTTAEHREAEGYEYNIAGFNCYHNTSAPTVCDQYNRVWDLNRDTGLDLRFIMATPAPTPPPPPPPTPPKTPAPTPAPTPRRTPTPTPRVVAVASAPNPSAPAPTPADTAAPTAPSGLTAAASASGALVQLSWSAASDDRPGLTYRLERSLDNVNWSELKSGITEVAYQDGSVTHGLRYFYRVQARDAAGNVSGYVNIDVRTADFVNNTDSNGPITFTSEDGVAGVVVETETFAEETECIVVREDSYKPSLKNGQSMIAGPYSLVCKTRDGRTVSEFSKPLTWNLNVKSKLGKLANPQVYIRETGSTPALLKEAVFNSKQGTVSFNHAGSGQVLVLASPREGFGVPVNLIVFMLAAIGLIALVLVLVLRRKQKTDYDDYLRSKYYNV